MKDEIIYSYIDEIGKRLGDPGLYGAASLMVGAGFSKNANSIGLKKNTPPDWKQLSFKMYDDLYPSEKDNIQRRSEECSGKNVLTLAQKYEVTFDRQALNSLIERSIADRDYIPSELHKNLLELNWNDIFTTNYDTLLERATEQIAARKNYKIVYSQDDLPGSIRPRIVKLHGSVEHSGQYIITEEDYRTYPDKHAPFVNTVQQSMLETRLCLLGFSGTDPNFLNWLGWLRDNMGEKCPAIYLCGLFDDLGTAERKMLEQRHITILDLSVLIDSADKNRHYSALKKFIDLLKQKSEKKKEKILNKMPYADIQKRKKDLKLNIVQYTNDMLEETRYLIDRLDEYVCLPQKEADSIGQYINNQLEVILKKENFDNKIILVNSYCRILKKCNCVLYDNIAKDLRELVDDVNIDENTKIDIMLYLLQMYRFDGKYNEYLQVMNKIELYKLDGGRNANEYLIECTKFYLCTFEINKANEYVDNIMVSGYIEYALKKASLLNQLKRTQEAKELITSTIAFVSQQKYAENRNASLIGYANLVARASVSIFNGQEIFSDSLYEDNVFNCRQIVVKSKELVIETIFENQRPQNRRVSSFNPNTYTINYILGNTGESKKIEAGFKYLLLQDSLCIGIYSDHKNTTDAAIRNIDKTSKYPMWRWYKILQINDQNIYNMYFTRERIYCAEVEFVETFFDQICMWLEKCLEEKDIKSKVLVNVKTLTDIAAKMTIVLDENRIDRFIKILIKIDESPLERYDKASIVNAALNIIHYSFNQKVFNYCIGYILDNKLIDYRFTSFFDEVKYVLQEEDEQKIKEKLIKSLMVELESDDMKIRDNAVNKFKIFDKILVNSTCYEQLRERVWSKVDNLGFPINKTYLPIAWVDDEKYNGEQKNITYLLNPHISGNYHKGTISSGGDADNEVYAYSIVLYRMLKLKDNSLFSIEQICKLIKYFCDYVENEKNIIDMEFDIMGQSTQTKDRIRKINDIVLLLCTNAKMSNDSNEEFENVVNRFLTQMDELGIPSKCTRLLLADSGVKDIFAEFEMMILGGNEKEIPAAFTMLYGCVQILHNKGQEVDIDELLVRFIQKLPYLDIGISKRVIIELHSILQRNVFLKKENIAIVINMLRMCYGVFERALDDRMKYGLDGMYNISNLAKTYYNFLRKNNLEINSEFETLIEKLKGCKLNEVKLCWT